MPKPRNARRVLGQSAMAAKNPSLLRHIRGEAARLNDPLHEFNIYLKEAQHQNAREKEAAKLHKNTGVKRSVFYSSKFAKDALKNSIQRQKAQKRPRLP